MLQLRANPRWYEQENDWLFLTPCPGPATRVKTFSNEIKRRKGGINIDELVLCSVCIVMVGFGQDKGRRILDDYFEEVSAASRKRYVKGIWWVDRLVNRLHGRGKGLRGLFRTTFEIL